MNPIGWSFLDAAKKFILFVACIHLAIIIVYAVMYQDITILNVFNIMDLDLFFPDIFDGLWSQMLSVVTMTGLFCVFFIFFTKKPKGMESEEGEIE